MLKFSDLSRAGFPFMTEPLGIMEVASVHGRRLEVDDL